VVVGLGALGVVVRARVDVEPEYEVAQYVYEGLTWDQLAAHFDDVTAAGDSVSLFTTYAADIAQVWVKRRLPHAPGSALFGARPAAADLHPVPGAPAANCTPQLGVPGRWSDRLPHFKMGFTPSSGDELQSELFVARGDAWAAIEALRSLSGQLAPHLLTSEIRTIAADTLWISPHYQRDSVGFHFTWRPDEDQAMRAVAMIESALSELAPRPHWGKLFAIDAGTLATRYPRHADFVDLIERFDPRRAFRNGWLERNLLG
jgi:xylitol oxidase